jgi:Predicted enzyme related to lactoylglutathione lyase
MAVSLRREKMPECEMAVFPYEPGLPGGALIKCAQLKPSMQGVVIYLHTDDIAATLKRVTENGGECAFGPQILPNDIGTIALFIDGEGNRIGLHQPA